jgi:aspartyl/asparaginyl beta-hydroxylase (cupin superfamily)
MSKESSGCLGPLVMFVFMLTLCYALISTILTTTPTFIQKDKQNYACWAEEFRLFTPEKTRWSCVKVEYSLYGKTVR